MWVIVRPLTKNTGLGEGSLLTSSIVVENGVTRHSITAVVHKVLHEIIRKAAPTTTTQVSEDAEIVAREWSSYIVGKIFSISNSNPICVKAVPSKEKRMRGGDMAWAINNLPKETYLHALGSCFWKIYNAQGKTTKKAISTYKHCLPFLHELGVDVVKESEECWNSRSSENSSRCHITDLGGKLVLLNWMSEILMRAMNMAGTVCSKRELKRITATDMFSALNWARLNLLVGTPLPSHSQVMNKKKRKRTSETMSTAPEECYNDTCSLPQDLLETHVFPNLPLKSLSRFKCVCKKWRESISSSYLRCSRQGTQRNHSTVSLAIINSQYKIKYEDIVSECDGLEVVLLDTVSYNRRRPYLYGSCSGLLCFAISTGRGNWTFTVGNPVTKEWHQLPPTIFPHSHNDWLCHGPGLAVDTSNNPPSYKLVVSSFGQESHFFQVFSSETWEWKPLHAKPSPEIGHAKALERVWYSVYIDGVLYYNADNLKIRKLVWLDPTKDMAGIIDLPVVPCERCAIGSLEKLDGRKSLTCSVKVDRKRVEIYVLVEKSEWEILHFIDVTGRHFMPYPYYGGEIVLVWKDEEIVSYDLRTGEWTLIAKDKYRVISGRDFFPYKMSLLPLPEAKKKLEVQTEL